MLCIPKHYYLLACKKGDEKTEHGGRKVVEEHGALAFVPERPLPSPLAPSPHPAQPTNTGPPQLVLCNNSSPDIY